MAYIKKIHFIISKGYLLKDKPDQINKDAFKNIGKKGVNLITLLVVDCIGNTIGIAVGYDKHLDCCLTRIYANTREYVNRFINSVRYIKPDHSSFRIEPYEYPSFNELKKALINSAIFLLDKKYDEGKMKRPTTEDAVYGPLIKEGGWYNDILLNNFLNDNDTVPYQETFCQPQYIDFIGGVLF